MGDQDQLTGKSIDGTLWAVTYDRSKPEIVSVEWYQTGDPCKHCSHSPSQEMGEAEVPVDVWHSVLTTIAKQCRGDGLRKLQAMIKEQTDFNKLRIKERGQKSYQEKKIVKKRK